MLSLFIPTARNHYHAYLIRPPILLVLVIFAYVINTTLGIFPITQVAAQIEPQTLLELHNSERKKAGLPPLKLNASLTNSAQSKALAMKESNCWSHYCPDGKTPWEFFTQAGYNYLYAGENLAEGYFDVEQAISAWMTSPTHRENILRPEFEEIGFGIVQGEFQGVADNIIITVHFATPQPLYVNNESNIGIYNSDLPTPIISSPAANSVLGSADIEVSGSALEASQVTLFLGGTEWAKVDALAGIFTHQATLADASYELTVLGEIGKRKSSISNPTRFRVDTVPDGIAPDQLLVVANTGDHTTIQINAPHLSKLTLLIGRTTIDFVARTSNIWEGEVPLLALQSEEKFRLANRDTAGHTWQGEFDSSPILDQAGTVPGFTVALKGFTTPPGFQVTQQSANMLFIVGLAALFGSDFLILSRTGQTKRRSRSHLHFGVLLVVLLLITTTSLTGSISSEGLVSF